MSFIPETTKGIKKENNLFPCVRRRGLVWASFQLSLVPCVREKRLGVGIVLVVGGRVGRREKSGK